MKRLDFVQFVGKINGFICTLCMQTRFLIKVVRNQPLCPLMPFICLSYFLPEFKDLFYLDRLFFPTDPLTTNKDDRKPETGNQLTSASDAALESCRVVAILRAPSTFLFFEAPGLQPKNHFQMFSTDL